jgi:hypothetical protein
MTLVTILITVVAMAVAMLLLGIGVMFRGRCLRGTCGGEGVIGPNGEILTCDTCPNREKIERELQRSQEDEAEKAKPSMTAR